MIVRSFGAFMLASLMAAPVAAQEALPLEEGRDGATVTVTDPEVAVTSDAAPVDAPAAPPAPVPVATAGDPGNFQIGPEDVLDISVWRNEDLSRVVPVRPDGRISLPLVNDIQAAGLTPTELRAQITQRLSAFVPNAEVSVIVREVRSSKVSITGAVRMPGTYEVKSAATVLDMIARAQGLTEFARRDRIVVHRQGQAQPIPFNYERVAEGRDENIVVQPGDIIVVP